MWADKFASVLHMWEQMVGEADDQGACPLVKGPTEDAESLMSTEDAQSLMSVSSSVVAGQHDGRFRKGKMAVVATVFFFAIISMVVCANRVRRALEPKPQRELSQSNTISQNMACGSISGGVLVCNWKAPGHNMGCFAYSKLDPFHLTPYWGTAAYIIEEGECACVGASVPENTFYMNCGVNGKDVTSSYGEKVSKWTTMGYMNRPGDFSSKHKWSFWRVSCLGTTLEQVEYVSHSDVVEAEDEGSC